MTDEERAQAIDEMVADPEKTKAEALERARRENPGLTDEQIEASWALTSQLL